MYSLYATGDCGQSWAYYSLRCFCRNMLSSYTQLNPLLLLNPSPSCSPQSMPIAEIMSVGKREMGYFWDNFTTAKWEPPWVWGLVLFPGLRKAGWMNEGMEKGGQREGSLKWVGQVLASNLTDYKTRIQKRHHSCALRSGLQAFDF